jgi:hypothetical protein
MKKRARKAMGGGAHDNEQDAKDKASMADVALSRRDRMLMAMGGCTGPGCKGCDSSKCYAKGGFIEDEMASGYKKHAGDDVKMNARASRESARSLGEHGEDEMGPDGGGEGFHGERYEGNPGNEHDEYQDPDAQDDDDLVGQIMKQRMYSKGGQIANETPITADFEKNDFDLLAKDGGLDSEIANDTGLNSGDYTDDKTEDEERDDIIAQIMKSRAKKDRMPRPA